ncbi:MAG: hypothetical protein ABJA02_11525 [Acidobacteriota bacterium]
MATFPLAHIPAQSYSSGGRAFGNDRGDVLHPGCDLMAPPGTEIYAVEDGTVVYGVRQFFESGAHVKDKTTNKWVCAPGVHCLMVYDILIKHSTFLARYGEIGIHVPAGVIAGAEVTEGQLVAVVGAQTVSTMLHFEMYSNGEDLSYPTEKGNMHYLNFKPKRTFSRRKDLMDPTYYLNNCYLKSSPRPNPGPF